jgi:hypothetical protein
LFASHNFISDIKFDLDYIVGFREAILVTATYTLDISYHVLKSTTPDLGNPNIPWNVFTASAVGLSYIPSSLTLGTAGYDLDIALS